MPHDLRLLRELWDKQGYPRPGCERGIARRLAWASYAASVLRKEIRKGNMLKAKDIGLACVDCGSAAEVWEHRDYTKPLDVDPCCISCNLRRGKAYIPDYFPEPTEYQLRRHGASMVWDERKLMELAKRGRKPPRRKS